MALAFARLRPLAVTPQVELLLPDDARLGGHRGEVIRNFHRAAELLVSCRVDFAVAPDSMLRRLPPTTKAIVYPTPLNPSDEIVEQLKTFVEVGGVVYLSGDIGYDRQRRPTRPERLRQLCGVEKIADEGSPLRPIRIKLAGAEAVQGSREAPVVTRYRLRKGQVWYAADPPEAAGEIQPEHRRLYHDLLAAAGAPVAAAQPDTAELHVFHIPGEDADAWVLYNCGAAVVAHVAGFSIELPPQSPGYLLVGHDGSLRAVEAEGVVRRGEAIVAEVQGHAFLVAMDDADLTASHALLLFPLQPGEIRLVRHGSMPDGADTGELRNGRWEWLHGGAWAHVAGNFQRDRLVIPIPPELAGEILRVQPRVGK